MVDIQQPPYPKYNSINQFSALENVNILINDGSTPLIMTVRTGTIADIEHLINRGADINMVDNKNKSPLWHACHIFNIEKIELLLSLNADMLTPLYVFKNPLSVLDYFIKFEKCRNVLIFALIQRVPQERIHTIGNRVTKYYVENYLRERKVSIPGCDMYFNNTPTKQSTCMFMFHDIADPTLHIKFLMYRICRDRALKCAQNFINAVTLKHNVFDNSIYCELPNGVSFLPADIEKDNLCIAVEKDGKRLVFNLFEQTVYIYDEIENLLKRARERRFKCELPREFVCAVCLEPLFQPCATSVGNVYCKICIEEVIASGLKNDPLTNLPMDKQTYECHLISKLMKELEI